MSYSFPVVHCTIYILSCKVFSYALSVTIVSKDVIWCSCHVVHFMWTLMRYAGKCVIWHVVDIISYDLLCDMHPSMWYLWHVLFVVSHVIISFSFVGYSCHMRHVESHVWTMLYVPLCLLVSQEIGKMVRILYKHEFS